MVFVKIMIHADLYAAPLELGLGVGAFSINIPLLTELFRFFSKH